MENTANKMELIDKLAELAKCFYLSDLMLPQYRDSLKEALGLITWQDYTLEDWNNTANYLTHGEGHFSNGEDARRYLLATL